MFLGPVMGLLEAFDASTLVITTKHGHKRTVEEYFSPRKRTLMTATGS